ncbi:MAG: glycosyltransferase family 4 protein, partial [Pyrinomonadaceae bacterium]
HWLQRLARRIKPDLAICDSHYVKTLLPSIFGNVRSEVFYYPLAPRESSVNGARKLIREELKTASEAVVITQISRLEKWKGHRLHLEALGRLKDVQGWVCWVVGGSQRPHEEEYLNQLKAQANQLGIGDRVIFLGQRTDVRRILSASDIHCQPNIGPEPFGVVFTEALSEGVPVVTTSMGGAREVIDKTCGVLVPEGDVDAIANALRQLIDNTDLRRSMGAAGPHRVKLLCDPERQLNQLHNMLKSGLEEAGKGAPVSV